MQDSNELLQKYRTLAESFFYDGFAGTIADPDLRQLLHELCHCLDEGGRPSLFNSWLQNLVYLFNSAKNREHCYHRIENALAQVDVALPELLSDLASMAVVSGNGASLMESMSQLAELSGSPIFRFLSAWSALNINDLSRCIQECENEDHPFASIYTIHGQALIELGKVAEAIEVLQIAIKLAPRELLAWFQLAKAHHLQNNIEECWASLLECRKISGSAIEVCAFMAILALSESPVDMEKLTLAFNCLLAHLDKTTCGAHWELIKHLFELVLAMENRTQMAGLVQRVDFDTLRSTQEFVQYLPRILQKLQDLKWFDISKAFLDKIIVEPENVEFARS